METVIIFFLCLATFAFAVCPLVCLVLLIVLVRRQGEMRWTLERLTGELTALRRRLSGNATREAAPASTAQPAGAAAESHAAVAAKSKPAADSGSPSAVTPDKPASPPPSTTARRQAIPPAAKPAAARVGGTDDGERTPSRQSPPPPPLRKTAPLQPEPTVSAAPVDTNVDRATRPVLKRLWNWFLYGADSLPPGTSLEYAVASNWLLRAGILIGVLGVGFFLKYSLDRNWIGDAGRCVLSAIAGLAMVAAGLRLAGRRFHLMALGLIGGGFVVLYWSVYAATVIYALLPRMWALPTMIIITLAAGILAVRLKSPLVAVIGIVGGYGSPILMSMQQADLLGILLYLLVLGCGVLGISFWRNWHLLNYLGLVFTYAVCMGLHGRFTSDRFWLVLPFLALYFALYAATLYIHSFVRRERSTLIDLAGQLLNSLLFFLLAGELIADCYSTEWVATLSLTLSLFFFLHLIGFSRRKLSDPPLRVCLTGLSAFYLTIGMPILLSKDWLTVAWSMQAAVMLWASVRLRSVFLRKLAYLLYGITLVRVLTFDLGREFLVVDAVSSSAAYWSALLNRFLVFLMPVGSLFFGSVLAGTRWQPEVDREPAAVEESGRQETVAGAVLFWCALLLGFLYLNLEFSRFYQAVYQPLLQPGLTLIWVSLCAYLVARVYRGDSVVAIPLAIVFGAGLFIKVLAFDLSAWGFDPDLFVCGRGVYDITDASMRGLDFALVLGVLLWATRLAPSVEDNRPLRVLLGFLGIGVLLFYMTLEINTALTIFRPGFRAGGVSILWSLFALGFVFRGLQSSRPDLRYIGLVLFLIVVGKVFLRDLAQLEPLFRIVAFIVLGVLVTGGAFVYLSFRHSFESTEATTDNPSSRNISSAGGS